MSGRVTMSSLASLKAAGGALAQLKIGLGAAAAVILLRKDPGPDLAAEVTAFTSERLPGRGLNLSDLPLALQEGLQQCLMAQGGI